MTIDAVNGVTPVEPTVHTVLTIVCAWCYKPMGTKDGLGTTGVTHSICLQCAGKMTETK